MIRFTLLLLILSIIACQAPTDPPAETPSLDQVGETGGYDAALAQALGADEYGMKPFVMAFLKAGPNRSQDSLEAARLQKAHLDNIGRMAEAGQLVLAGPFMDDGDVRGIYIFNVATLEEAEALTATDPAIQAGRLEMELHPWYGSAALMQINDVHKTLMKEDIAK